jgi:hypothetical protein
LASRKALKTVSGSVVVITIPSFIEALPPETWVEAVLHAWNGTAISSAARTK